MPDLSDISQGFKQTTLITDRNGETLYKLFDENREYVAYENISEHMVNAMIAAEDQNFWTNEWVDYNGLIRAVWITIKNWSLSGPGGSTITQQLIKLLLLSNEKTLTRKAKEIILATRIDDYLQDEVRKEMPELSSTERKKEVKKRIIEMYLNYIFLGNNSHWVEAASKTYFGKSAKDLDIVESAIVASMAQRPSTVNPYRNVHQLMGAFTVTSDNEEVDITTGGVKQQVINRMVSNINDSSKSISKSAWGFMSYVEKIGEFKIEIDGQKYNVEYTPGRKDYVLSRMYEDGYIDAQQAKDAFIEWLNYEFKTARIDIKAPHFVFWVIERLKESGYTEEQLTKWGLTIKTTLDIKAQDIAERSIIDNIATVNSYGANNSSLVYLDSLNGDILAYVGSADYNNEEIDGKVDMVQQLRQPGSSIKPLIYAYGFMNLPLAIDTPIYDIPFTVGNDRPNNNDAAFEGLMPLRRALGYSRNIPAIKMYFAAGWQDKIIPYLNDLGIASYDTKKDYGYPLAIGAGELKMIELANAYTQLSSVNWAPAKINPILEVKWPDGNILYQKSEEQEKLQKKVIPWGVAYLLWKILTNEDNLPPSWVANFRVSGLVYGNKSGTTDMKDPKTGKKLPRDGWLVGYTPSKVAVFWAGNTQGNPMNVNAYGGWVNGRTFRQFFSQLLREDLIQSENVSPIEVKDVAISKVSGKIVTENTPEDQRVSSLAYIGTVPSEADNTMTPIQIDKACMGKVSDVTPREDIINWYIFRPSTFMPNNMDLDDIANWRKEKTAQPASWDVQQTNIFVAEPTQVCEARESLWVQDNSIEIALRQPKNQWKIAQTFSVWYDVNANASISKVRIMLDNEYLGDFAYANAGNRISDIKRVAASHAFDGSTNHALTVIATDTAGRYNKKTITVQGVWSDTVAPYLLTDTLAVRPRSDGRYDVIMLFVDDLSAIKGGTISMTDGTQIHTFNGNATTYQIQIPQTLTYKVEDAYGNIVQNSIDLTQYITQ